MRPVCGLSQIYLQYLLLNFIDHDSSRSSVYFCPNSSLRSTPILLAASSGGLSVLKGLIELGADYRRLDGENNGIVSLAAMRFHTNVLEYLIEWNNPDVHVWEILVGM